jgi:hypothetical protein
MDQVTDWSKENKFQLIPKNCKELRISFTMQSHVYEHVSVSGDCEISENSETANHR